MIAATEASSQRIGMILLLWRLVCKPEAEPKMLRISLVTCNSSSTGLVPVWRRNLNEKVAFLLHLLFQRPNIDHQLIYQLQ